MPVSRLSRMVAALLAIAFVLPAPAAVVASAPLSIVEAPAAGLVAAGWVPDRLIVRWRAGTDAAQRRSARATEQLTRLGGLGIDRLELVRVHGRPDAVAARLAHNPSVEYAEPDYLIAPLRKPTDEAFFDELWGLRNTGQTVNGDTGTAGVDIHFRKASAVTRGDPSLVVAVIDDGVDFSHPDLADRAWTNPGESGGGRETNGIDDDGNGYVDDVHGWNFVYDGPRVHDFDDDFHGTHVAGTIAASLNGAGTVGVAPRVQIMALKFLGPSGGSTADAIAAVNYAAANGADLINASWGGPGGSNALRDAISASRILMVAAAGNEGIDNDASSQRSYPASYDLHNIIAVAAVDQDGQVPSFSNYGATSVDIAAPGVNILSSFPETSDNPPALAFMDGTSMAAPHVTGVAALALSVRPGLRSKPAKLRKLLIDTGSEAPPTAGSTASGRIVNARGAIDTAAPKVGAVRAKIAVDKTLSGAGSPVRIWWSASDPASGVDRYRVQLQTDGGPWVAFNLPTPTATEIMRRLDIGHTYRLRVRAWDHAGNRSLYRLGQSFIVARRQEGAGIFDYTGAWERPGVAGASGGRLRTTDEADASVSFAFTGSSIAWVAQPGPTTGKARVYVDGVKITTIDLADAGSLARTVVFQKSWHSAGAHTVEIQVVGTASRPTVNLDAVTWLR